MLVNDEQISKVILSQPGLTYHEKSKCLVGQIQIDEDDSYSVIIDLSIDSEKFPRVLETGERIPQTMDRHKFPQTDVCCLTTEARAQILIRTKIRTLSSFVDLIVVPFFQNNSYYEINRTYLQGEYSHGPVGIIEGYQDILKIENPWVIEKALNNRLAAVNKNRNSNMCFCGSGKSLRACEGHLSAMRHFKMIDISVIQKDLKIISDYLRMFELYHLGRPVSPARALL